MASAKGVKDLILRDNRLSIVGEEVVENTTVRLKLYDNGETTLALLISTAGSMSLYETGERTKGKAQLIEMTSRAATMLEVAVTLRNNVHKDYLERISKS